MTHHQAPAPLDVLHPWRAGPARSGGRLLRAGVFAFVTVLLGVAAHRLAGGSVSTLALAIVAVVAAAAGWMVAARERGPRYVVAVVLGSQLTLHAALMGPAMFASAAPRARQSSSASLAALFFCRHGSMPISATMLRQAMHGVRMPTMPTAGSGMQMSASMTSTLLMVATHLIAATLVAWWMCRGERACWAIAREAVTLLQIARGQFLTAPVVVVVALSHLVQGGRRYWSDTLQVRGPPARFVLLPSTS